jgi:hypothetical protein
MWAASPGCQMCVGAGQALRARQALLAAVAVTIRRMRDLLAVTVLACVAAAAAALSIMVAVPAPGPLPAPVPVHIPPGAPGFSPGRPMPVHAAFRPAG